MRTPCPTCGSRTGFKEFEDTSYCFKCHKWTPKGYAGIYKPRATPTTSSLLLPPKLVYNPQDMHPEALQWLFQYYIFEGMIKKYSIAYIPDRHRVFLPILDKNRNICYYITRGLIPGDIKYLTCKGVKPQMCCIENSTNQAIVLVEDYISAIRLGEHYNVVFVQGTSLSRKLINYIVDKYTHVVTWFDSDEPGKNAARNAETCIREHELRTLENRIYTRPDPLEQIIIKNVCTEKDPKCYTDSEIRDILG